MKKNVIKSDSILKKRVRRFKSIKRGYYSLIILSSLYLISLIAPVIISKEALVVCYANGTYDNGEEFNDINQNGMYDDSDDFEVDDPGKITVEANSNETMNLIITGRGVDSNGDLYSADSIYATLSLKAISKTII